MIHQYLKLAASRHVFVCLQEGIQKLIPYVFHFSYHFFDEARAELRPEFNCHQDAAGPMGPSLSGSFEGELLWKMWSLGRPKGGWLDCCFKVIIIQGGAPKR